MGSRTRWALALTPLLGAAAVAIPSVAGSETVPAIEAFNTTGVYAEQVHYWRPSQVTVAPGGAVAVSNPTEVPHGVHWVGGPAVPACTGVPVGTEASASATHWNGSCTFAAPGVYTFYCTVHGSEMTGRVTVQAPGETTPTTTTTTSTSPPPGSGGEQGAGSPAAGSPQPAAGGSPLAGAGLRLSAALHRGSVRGSLRIGAAGAGGRLEVDLLAPRAALAGAGAARSARVGRWVRQAVPAGLVSFTVALEARARHALARHHRLALTVRVLLTPPHGVTATLSRKLLLRR